MTFDGFKPGTVQAFGLFVKLKKLKKKQTNNFYSGIIPYDIVSRLDCW